jgi:transitional endoplasmic reticulum ATPase
MNSLQLQVKEGYDDDPIGRARIDHDCMDSLNMQDDDVVEITGERRTVARCWASHPAKDEGKGIIRIDRIIRINAGTEIGSPVMVRKINAVPAMKVVVTLLKIAPFKPINSLNGRALSRLYDGLALRKGDSVMFRHSSGSWLTLEVDSVTPAADAVAVTKNSLRILV